MRVLVVEDDSDLALLIDVWLDRGSEILMRGAAEDVTDSDIDWCDAVLADWRLPGADGCAVIGRVKARRPDVRCVLWSALADLVTCESADVVLMKPQPAAQVRMALGGS